MAGGFENRLYHSFYWKLDVLATKSMHDMNHDSNIKLQMNIFYLCFLCDSCYFWELLPTTHDGWCFFLIEQTPTIWVSVLWNLCQRGLQPTPLSKSFWKSALGLKVERSNSELISSIKRANRWMDMPESLGGQASWYRQITKHNKTFNEVCLKDWPTVR